VNEDVLKDRGPCSKVRDHHVEAVQDNYAGLQLDTYRPNGIELTIDIAVQNEEALVSADTGEEILPVTDVFRVVLDTQVSEAEVVRARLNEQMRPIGRDGVKQIDHLDMPFQEEPRGTPTYGRVDKVRPFVAAL